ncbi:MAG: DUF2752 domain-containing protein [Crocinitomicaceae bacterium]|nr:DUF2752 domain-containing protein [Crocinitomicaceae bacterium]
MIQCSWKEQFGIECLTCGFQRSVVLLFQGDVLGSIKMFPSTIPLIICFGLLLVHLKIKLKNGAKWLTILFASSAVLMVINYGVKMVMGTNIH